MSLAVEVGTLAEGSSRVVRAVNDAGEIVGASCMVADIVQKKPRLVW